MYKKLLLIIIATASSVVCSAQQVSEEVEIPSWSVKTNLLYDVTATINLGFEAVLGDKNSLDLSINYNPWTFGNDKKWKHILLQPEFRFWIKEHYQGWFFGPHAHYAYYNVGGLSNPPFSNNLHDNRFQGWLVGAGISGGYRWNFSDRIGLETVLGIGYAYLSYNKYECGHCGDRLGSETLNYIGPTKAAVSLVINLGKTKRTPKVDPVRVLPVVETQLEPKAPYVPRYTATYIIPAIETVKQRCEEGKAYLDFVVGRSEIVSSFKNNAAELKKIHTLIEETKNDPNATITGITITGFASPEGSYASNKALSERRASALKNHIKSLYSFPENLFTVSGKGEDWETLDSIVLKSNMTDKYRLLEIIRGTDVFDGRENRLMKLASGHALKTDVYPLLRRTDYELHYTVLPFTVEQGKVVFRQKPSSLSLNEMFMVANTYEPGSVAFNEVFETAARIFPDSDVANLNAAANALGRKDVVSARRYLSKVSEQGRDAAYHNNMGMLYGLQGEYDKAATEFELAKAGGNAEATGNASETANAWR